MENIALLERIIPVIIAILVTNLWGRMEVEREWNKEYSHSFFCILVVPIKLIVMLKHFLPGSMPYLWKGIVNIWD